MKLFRFRDWNVYKDARKFRLDILKEVCSKIQGSKYFALNDQLSRALISVILNIAEGSYRATKKDFAKFLNHAITSINEIVACLDLCLDDGIIDEVKHSQYLGKADNLIKQLNAFAKSILKN